MTTRAMAVAAAMGGNGGCSRDVRLSPVASYADAADNHPDVGAGERASEGGVEGGGPPADAADTSIDLGRIPSDVGSVPIDGGGSDADAGTGGGACLGLGDPIRLPSSGVSVCSSALATRAYGFALCVCDSLGVIQPIKTDVINSSLGTIGGPASAAIGVNRDLQSDAEIQVAGALYVGGTGGLMTSMGLRTAASLRVAGPTSITSSAAQVAGDAYLGGDVSGILIVDGTLHVAPTAVTALAIITAKTTVREPVSVPPPCDCGASFVDIPGEIASTLQRNDNLAAGLAPDRLTAVSGSTVLDIPCGHYALSAIDAQQAVFLAVHGRALLAVEGDVLLRGGLTVVLDPGAELDLLVGGRLESSGGQPIGSAAPARFRIWVPGTDPVVFDDRPTVGAMIYAPQAFVLASGGLELSGGLFAETLISGQMNLHYDQAVLSPGVSCGPTATPVP